MKYAPYMKYEEASKIIREFVKDYWQKNLVPPSYRDIQRGLGFASSDKAYRWLHRMEERGEIILGENYQERAIRLPNMRVVFDD